MGLHPPASPRATFDAAGASLYLIPGLGPSHT